MRERVLRDALLAFTREAAERLAAEAAGGAELPFEVVEERHGRATPLYCYRPLTEPFIRERIPLLAHLPSWPAAVSALGGLEGVGDYLRARGEPRVPTGPRERSDATLRTFLQACFDDASEFALTQERFDAAWRDLHAAVFAGRSETVVVAPVLGLVIEGDEVQLGDGLSLWRGDALPGAPPAALQAGDPDEPPCALAVHAAGEQAGGAPPLDAARVRLRRLLAALRLFDTPRPALHPLAWWRAGSGPWQPAALGAGLGAPDGTLLVTVAGEDELRAFCSLVARRTPRRGELAWALRRYELGCERAGPEEALTDHLLALRALLEPEGPASGRLPGRLAALCAAPQERPALAERIAHAASVERGVVAGLAPATTAAETLAAEVAGHLRALLRDVLCGHLAPDLRAVADELIAGDAAAA